MRLFPTYLLLLLILSRLASAQDTLITFNDLSYQSEFEKTILEDHFVKNKSDYFALSISNGNLLNESAIASAREKFLKHISGFENEKFKLKKTDKRIKELYNEIHKTYLVKYELKNRFEDIFHRGHYNCVSASLLYALAFDQLKIPYHIIEKPTHVYLVAYPEKESIIIETTTPAEGSLAITEQFKDAYLKVLKEQKIISSQEYYTLEHNMLFNKYYFGEQKSITFDQLIGLQYLNQGIYLMEEKNHQKALKDFEKAYLFYPSERTGYLMMVCALTAFNETEKTDLKHAYMLAKLSRFKKYGIDQEMIKGEFAGVTQTLLFEKTDKSKMESYYNTLIENIDDPSLKNDISFIYYYELGRLYYNLGKYKEGLVYIGNAFALKPDHLEVSSFFINCLINSLKNTRTSDVIKTLHEYRTKHPALNEHNSFNLILSSSYLLEFDQKFQENDAVTGEKYRAMFEEFHKNHPDVLPDDHLMANAYSSAAIYYFKRNQKAKAKAILSAGLIITPENYELKMRKRMVE